ncbi:MAG: molybdenum ABC transporter ATP-binding protein [Alphaproteobacteria bacterium]|nr:MAG: molybdenum ABC transporter ATP-binding protein [Alphaproteobacteria bacterium]
MTVRVTMRHRLGSFLLDLSFALDHPGITALFGPSGAGKSTVINAVAGLVRPHRGRIEINGATVFDSEAKVYIPPRRRNVGYVFQDARLFPHLSVRRNLLYGWRRAARRASDKDIRDLVALLGLESLLDRRPVSLSGGERQRVAIGRALLKSPDILLLDEPLAGLDRKRRDEILPYLARLRDRYGIPMLYVSHDIDEVARLADQVQIIDNGRIVASGPVSEVFTRLDLFPLTGRFEAGTVIDARIVAHDDGYGLTRLHFDGGTLTVPRVDAETGALVRVRVRAQDIVIALSRPDAISANNVLAATITDLRVDPETYADVQLSCGGARLVARITRQSLDRLALEVGKKVFAVIKSVTIIR